MESGLEKIEEKPLTRGKSYRYSETLSIVMLAYIILFTLMALMYAVVSFVFNLSTYFLLVINVIFLVILIILTYLCIIKVYKPLSKIERAMQLLEGESRDFNIDFDEKNDIYPLSIQLNELIKNLKDSMNREYTASILRKQAEINALQSQINPHFLYNVLDSIRGHALMEDMDEIAEMTEALSILFRYSISGNSSLVTLESELKNIKNYFKIQQYRFNNKFELNIRIDGEEDKILSYQLPKLTIQPILENSIYHGLEMKMDKGNINIRIEATEERLIVIISDDGIGMDSEQLKKVNDKLNRQIDIEQEDENKKKTGIALSNVNQRIKMLFGEEYGVYIDSTQNIGTDVEIVLPRIES